MRVLSGQIIVFWASTRVITVVLLAKSRYATAKSSSRVKHLIHSTNESRVWCLSKVLPGLH